MRLRKEFQITAGCPHHRGLVECRIDSRRLTLWLSLCQLTVSQNSKSSSVPTLPCALRYVLFVCPHGIPSSSLPLSLIVYVSGKATIKTHVYPLTLLGWPVSRSIPSTHLPGRHESPIGYPFLPTIMLVCVCIPPWTLCNGFMRGNSCPRREPGRSSPVRDVRNLGKISSADVLMVCERQCYLHITWSGAFAFFLLNERLKSRT